uniref:ATP synthase subunit delta, chloroplastic n=1 Tax=Dipterocladia arabiensis TaxID=2007176 RepID=A0A1Z1M0T2_9FLOR|nr:ATP synthase CF1 subunit delta [Dipterocladia arabiensis]ARW59375.1 ATP synthase CF1 subunit delta [Dipterocladia arabiensis]
MINQNMTDKISVPYAEALLELAKNKNLLSEMEQDLNLISTTLSNSKDLQLFLVNPSISILVKKKILITLFKDQINNVLLNFLSVLVDRRRISLLSFIIDKYLELTYQLNSITIAELSTAVEFNEIQQKALIEKIKLITKSNNVKLVININPSLIAGFVVTIGSKVIDASLSGKLKQMSFYLNTN